MRKKYLLGMTLMASLAFYSCTKEVFVVQDGEGVEEIQEDGQVLTLQVSNSGDGLTTRAGRPLLSSQAKQDINTIVLYVVNESNKVVLKKTISPDEWANALDYSTNGHGKQLQITFRNSDGQKLTTGNYTIYAVGYKTEASAVTSYKVSDADFGVTSTEGQLVVPVKVGQEGANATLEADKFSAQLAKTYDNSIIPADEIFAGVIDVTATDDYLVKKNTSTDTKVVPALVLNRQVAGVTGYFTNLPAKVGDQIPAKVRLVASNKSNKVHFTSMLPGETGTDQTVKNVVNGSWSGSEAVSAEKGNYWKSSNTGYIVYEIALSKFFPQLLSQTFESLDLDKDNFVGYKDAQYYVYKMGERSNDDGESIKFTDLAQVDTDGKTFLEKTWSDAIQGKQVTVNGKTITANKLEGFWKNPNEKTQTLVAGSVFAGEFIIPFLQSTDVNTFELQLLDEDDNILKTWNVQVPNDQTVSGGLLAAGIDGQYQNDMSTLIYNIYRNHLYSLGLKANDIEEGGDPENPDPKPEPDPDPNPEDKPEDLSKGQDLLINVNDNWEIIHNMVID